MERAEQIRIAERLLALVESKSTDFADKPYERDAAAYASPERHEHECDLFFRRTPLWAAFSSDLAQPGDFVTHDDSGAPLLIVRNDDGSLGAFHNICRHRGTRVVLEARGNARKAFTCPYHGWTYGRNGRLMGIPCRSAFDGMPEDRHSLTRVSVAEKYGMVFVCPTPGVAIDLDEHLGPIGPEMERWGVGQTHFTHERRLDSPINWKFALDVFAEGYHFTVLHTNTIGLITHDNTATYDRMGRHYRLAFPSLDIESLRSIPREEWVPLDHMSLVYYIYPNLSLNVTGAKVPTVRVFRISPGRDAGHSSTRHTLYTVDRDDDPEARRLLLQHFDYMHRVVEEEDHSVAIRAQANLNTRPHSSFVFGRNEPGLIHMHRQYEQMLAHDRESSANQLRVLTGRK